MTGKIVPISNKARALQIEAQANQIETILVRHGLPDARITAGDGKVRSVDHRAD